MIVLHEFGIRLRDERPGERRGACPRCAAAKARPGDDALAVKLGAGGGAMWLCHRCGWSGALPPPGEPRRMPRRPAPPEPGPPDRKVERTRERAREAWRQAGPLPSAGPARDYLVGRRCITTWDADRLLWHPACPWSDGLTGRPLRVPTIIAPISDWRSGLVVAVWRIRLDTAGDGKVERRGLGPTRRNAARLSHVPGAQLVVAEGVEDALAARELTGLPAWAALSAGNMGDLILPERIREVLILADRDVNGTGQENAHKLAVRLRAEGRHAEVRRPTTGKDPNDVLQLSWGAR